MSRSLSRCSRRDWLAATLATGGAVACAPILPVTRPDPARFDACPKQRRLKVLTWNIFMMPEWVKESPFNQPRAAAIAQTLLEQDFDILCLQKCFDAGARDVLARALAQRYPYRYGPANPGCLLLNSGVWVLSRYPLTDYQTIEFRRCSSWECFSRKGALLVSGTCGQTPFRLVVTHLQGEEGAAFTTKNQAIRDQQMAKIRDRLLTPHLEPQVPFIICGDFGTPRFADAAFRVETITYRNMLATLGVDRVDETLITLDEVDNELAKSDTKRKNEVDYVFVRKNGYNLGVTRRRHVFKRGGWDPQAQRTDLSYHYAVSAELTF